LQFAEVIQAQHRAAGEHLQPLLGKGLAAVGEVVHRADRTIRKAQLDREGVRARLAIGSLHQLHLLDRTIRQMAQQIHEMAGFTQQAPPT